MNRPKILTKFGSLRETPTPYSSTMPSAIFPSPRTTDVKYDREALALITATSIYFIFNIYTLVISKLMPPSSYQIIQWIQKDNYYTFMIPLLGPVICLFVLFNWLGMKLFKTNI